MIMVGPWQRGLWSSRRGRAIEKGPQMQRGPSTSQRESQRRQHLLQFLLIKLLHPDVAPIVLCYEATILLHKVRSFPENPGDLPWGQMEGALNTPFGLVLHRDELFVMDTWHYQIQVFHQDTGRFLRRWDIPHIVDDDKFQHPISAVITFSPDRQEEEIFVLTSSVVRSVIWVFGSLNGKFSRRLRDIIGSATGIGLLNNQFFVARCNPNQIDIIAISDGKVLGILKLPEESECFTTCRPHKLFIEPDTKEIYVAQGTFIRALNYETGCSLREYGRPMNREVRLKDARAVVASGEQIIVCDCQTHRLVVFDRSTHEVLQMSSNDLQWPRDLAVNDRNELFVCDGGNNRIVMFE